MLSLGIEAGFQVCAAVPVGGPGYGDLLHGCDVLYDVRDDDAKKTKDQKATETAQTETSTSKSAQEKTRSAISTVSCYPFP